MFYISTEAAFPFGRLIETPEIVLLEFSILSLISVRRLKYLFIWVSGCYRFTWELLVTYLALLAEIKHSGVLARATRQSREPEGEESRLLTYHTASSLGRSAHPACTGMFWLELEFSMAEIQTESKFDILFLMYTGSAWASWKPWQPWGFFDIKCYLSLPHLKSSTPFTKMSWSQ